MSALHEPSLALQRNERRKYNFFLFYKIECLQHLILAAHPCAARFCTSYKIRNYLPPPYTIFGKGEENSSRNEVKTFWLRLRKVEMAAWIRA